MKYEKKEVAKNNPDCEIRLGISSWDECSNSIKYTWFDVNERATRGGEFPVEALPQMVRMALEYGYLTAKDLIKG